MNVTNKQKYTAFSLVGLILGIIVVAAVVGVLVWYFVRDKGGKGGNDFQISMSYDYSSGYGPLPKFSWPAMVPIINGASYQYTISIKIDNKSIVNAQSVTGNSFTLSYKNATQPGDNGKKLSVTVKATASGAKTYESTFGTTLDTSAYLQLDPSWSPSNKTLIVKLPDSLKGSVCGGGGSVQMSAFDSGGNFLTTSSAQTLKNYIWTASNSTCSTQTTYIISSDIMSAITVVVFDKSSTAEPKGGTGSVLAVNS